MINDATQAGQSAESPATAQPAVAALRGVTKRFPGIVALNGVS
ncbi:MAG: hypothetical protein JWN43_391, partial [Gammaproteobacteria bacterium]|nr:hypothetical protein [Gammaproteobacteria bacterium]